MDAHRDDRGQALTNILAGEVLLQSLEEILGLGIGVDGSGQGGAETREMGAAVPVEDRVGEGEDIFGVAVVPLQRDLDFFAVVGLVSIEIDRVLVERRSWTG